MGLRHFLYFFLQPLIFLALATLHLPRTWVALVRDGQWGAFVSPSRFKGKWFAVLWRTAGPLVRAESEARVHALVEGRVSRGRVSAEPTSAPLRGSVMEVGAGSGMWTHLFKDAEAVYAVEPNAEQHGALVRRAAELGISDRYAVVGRGVQDLEPGPGLPPVDNVVTIFCFCSIPDPERNAKAVYRFLKPGGRWYVYEHVRCHPKQGRFMRVYQREWSPRRRGRARARRLTHPRRAHRHRVAAVLRRLLPLPRHGAHARAGRRLGPRRPRNARRRGLVRRHPPHGRRPHEAGDDERVAGGGPRSAQ